MNPDDLRKADAIEVVVGQGAKPGGGGMLMGHKINERVASMRTLPVGIDQPSKSSNFGRSPAGRSLYMSKSALLGRTTTRRCR
jgi:hypothetical protein